MFSIQEAEKLLDTGSCADMLAVAGCGNVNDWQHVQVVACLKKVRHVTGTKPRHGSKWAEGALATRIPGVWCLWWTGVSICVAHFRPSSHAGAITLKSSCFGNE